MSRLLLLSLLLLVACGGGETSGNETDMPPPVRQEAVPENLTDDAGNQAIPLDPPPTATPSAAPSPISSPREISAFPSSFQGRWGLVAADCEAGRSDNKGLMEVGAKSLRFYESRGVASRLTQAASARIEAALAFTGEGQEWTRVNTLTLINANTLVREERDPPNSLRYARCPA